MKKSLLALLIASTLVLSACDDKDTQAKLQTAEQTISQLNAQLEKSQAELKVAQEKRTEVPALQVKPVTLFEKRQEFNRDPDSIKEDDFGVSQSYVDYHLSSVETGITWLDDLLYNELIGDISTTEDKNLLAELKALPTPKDRLLKLYEVYYQEGLAEAKEFNTFGNELSDSVFYLGQRQNVVTFSHSMYTFTGGAHGNGWTDYINVDINKKAKIKLDDLIPKANQQQVQDLLWEAYKTYRQERSNGELYASQKDVTVSEAFYFTAEGINFVYPPYAIGYYAEGEITLTLYWNQVENLINKAYLWY
ncbi:DUF3298 domain-containing protein [Lonepinella sp. BR2357]|uniref:RsiV family protein n=1 Tax=Lonepinella sp. BR2357 TaxID=3434549 RepID=UPI003F6E12E4